MHPRAARLTLLLVLGAALLAHGRGLGGGFVYDDHRFIEQNGALSPVRPWDYLVDPGTASAASGAGVSADIYRPLRTLLFALEAAVFDGPAGWHVLSVLLHALNAVLVLLLLRTLFGAEAPAAVGAVLFAVHPVTVESVAWASSQGDLLALTLMLLALRVLERPGLARTFAGVALGALACLAKESAIVLPALLLLRDRALSREAAPPWSTTLARVGTLAVVVLGYFLLRAAVLPGDLAQVEDPGLAAKTRGFLTATAWYAGAVAWPSGFRFETDLLGPLSWGEPAVVMGLAIWLTVLGAGALAWRRGRPAVLVFAALGAAAALGPVSQVFVPLKSLAAERFLYPVLPCVVAAVGVGVLAIGRRWGPLAAWAPLALALPLAWTSVARTGAWHDEESLWQAVRRDRPTNARAFEGLGYALLQKGRFRDAERAYTSYFEANPFDGKAHYVFAGHLESLAHTLDSTSEDIRKNSDMLQRRREVLALTIAELGRALSAWDEIGLAAGRGSRAMAWNALGRIVNLSLELGDPAQARWANNRMLALSGVDPGQPAEVAGRAPYPLRRIRWLLAWTVLNPPPGDPPPHVRSQMLQVRADAVRDLGLDADQQNDLLLAQLEAPLVALEQEAEASLARAAGGPERGRALTAVLDAMIRRVELLDRLGRTAEARALLEKAQRRGLAEPLGKPR